jgi:hypothetical protein
VLAFDEAFVSHASAADAFGFRPSASALMHVTVRGRVGREPRAGIRIHRPRALHDDEVTTLRGLPITTPARTLLDLAAAGLRPRALETALDQAEQERVLDFAELHELLARYPRRPGTRLLKAQLARYQLCDARGLPRPSENTVIEGRVRDFRSPSALNDDRERDVELTLAGYTVLRFTWEQVTRRPEYVTRALRIALGAL